MRYQMQIGDSTLNIDAARTPELIRSSRSLAVKPEGTEYYTVPELAERWRCSPDVVYDMLRSGKLHGFKLGGAWRITEEARKQYEQAPNPQETKLRRPVLKIK